MFPARRASKVAPIAAMRDVAARRAGRSRGRVVAGLGRPGRRRRPGLAPACRRRGRRSWSALGALAVFVGVVRARPDRRPARSAGSSAAPLPRLRGMSGQPRPGERHAQPQAHAATAAALMIGVGLVGFITILAASAKASVDEVDRRRLHAATSSSTPATFGSGGLSPDLAAAARPRSPRSDAVTGLRSRPAEVDGHRQRLLGRRPGHLRAGPGRPERHRGSLGGLGDDGIAVLDDVAEDEGWPWATPSRAVRRDRRPAARRVAAIYDETRPSATTSRPRRLRGQRRRPASTPRST